MAIFFRPQRDRLDRTASIDLENTSSAHGRLRRRVTGPWWSPLLRDGVRPLFLAGDLLAVLIAALAVPGGLAQGVVFALLLLPLFSSAGLYQSRLVLSLLDDLPRLVGRWLVAVALLLAATALWTPMMRGFTTAVVAGVAVLVLRWLSYSLVRLFRRRHLVSHSTIVVGADATGVDVAERLLGNAQHGLAPIGFLDEPGTPAETLPAPLLGAPQDLMWVLDRYAPQALILAHGAMPDHELVALVRACHRQRCEVFVIPRLAELHHVSDDMEFVWDIPLVRLHRAAYRSPTWRLKRLLDIVFAALALLVLSPVMLGCALAVRLEGGPRVIFRQERVGLDGIRFSLLKFRSLRPVDETESKTQWNVSHDSRLGPVGRLLRVTSLDELPQLWNILQGDMSLVGPRPERPHFVDQFDGLYRGYSSRHRVPSGLTGWAQVHGLRGDTSIEDRAKFDNFYIENWSLWLDLKILLRTAVSVVTSPGS